jgi:hypothetical protein
VASPPVVADVIEASQAGIGGTLTPVPLLTYAIDLLTYAIDLTSHGPQKHPPNRVKGTGRPLTGRGGRGPATARPPGPACSAPGGRAQAPGKGHGAAAAPAEFSRQFITLTGGCAAMTLVRMLRYEREDSD